MIKSLLLLGPSTLLGAELGSLRTDAAPCRRSSDLAPGTPETVEWDRFVATVPGGDVVQTTAWAHAKRATGFEVTRVVSRRGDGTIVGGGFVVMKRFGPLGAVGYVARGPLLAPEAAGAIGRVLDDVERAARARGVLHLVVQPPFEGEAITNELAARGYTEDAPDVAPSATLVIDLAPDLDAILAGMSSARRRAVRQALKRGVQVRPGDERDIAVFQALHVITAERQGFGPLSVAYLREQWAALRPSGAVQLIMAEHGGRALAGIWLSAFGDTVTYRIPAWNGEEPQLQANVACHWEAIRWAKAQGYRWYDLGGIDRRYVEQMRAGESLRSGNEHSPAAFKVGFGGELRLLPRASQLTFDPLVRRVVRAGLSLAGRSRLARAFLTRLRNG